MDELAGVRGLGGEEGFDGSGGGAEVVAGLAAVVVEIVGDGVFGAAFEFAAAFDGVGGGGAEAIGEICGERGLEGAGGIVGWR